MVHHIRQVQLLPRDMRQIVERQKHHVPSACGAVCFCTQQNSVMECVHHRTVTEEESQSFGSVRLRKINAKLRRSIQNNLLQDRIDAVVAIQDPGSCRHAYMSFRGYFTKS